MVRPTVLTGRRRQTSISRKRFTIGCERGPMRKVFRSSFEAFDEQWKNADSPDHSENHFGLVTLDNELKYTLWGAFDEGRFAGLTRDGKLLRKSFSGALESLLASAVAPPFKSQMAVRKVETVNAARTAGEQVTEKNLVIVHDSLSGDSPEATFQAPC